LALNLTLARRHERDLPATSLCFALSHALRSVHSFKCTELTWPENRKNRDCFADGAAKQSHAQAVNTVLLYSHFLRFFAQIKGRATAALVCGYAGAGKNQKRLPRFTLPAGRVRSADTRHTVIKCENNAALRPGTQKPHPQQARLRYAKCFGFAGARCCAVKTSPPPLVAFAKNSPPCACFLSMIFYSFISRSPSGGSSKPASFLESSHKLPCRNQSPFGGRGWGDAPLDFDNAGLWKAFCCV